MQNMDMKAVYQTCQDVANSMLRQQGDNTVIVCQSCHAIVKQDDSHDSHMINLALVSFENMTVTFMDITSTDPQTDPNSQPPSWLGMYVCTTDEMTVTFSCTIPVDTFFM